MNEKIGEHQKEALFKRLLARNDNSICADCRSKGAAWASLDFGVFVCINCSGVHRSFGMHITRIRSTKLDDWIVCDYKVLETVGNQIANLYWEFGLRGKQAPSIASEDDRASFIKAKYQSKRYAMKGKKDPVSMFVDSNYSLKSDELRAMYGDDGRAEAKPAPTTPSKSTPEMSSAKAIQKPKKDESLIDFGFSDPVVPAKPLQMEKAKSAMDPFGFDLLGEVKTSKSMDPKPADLFKPAAPVKHHDFQTSDLLFDFTKTTTSFPPQLNTHAQASNGNIYNINNLTVFNQNFTAPQGNVSSATQFNQTPTFGGQPQPQATGYQNNPHLDRYAVFDAFKMNYQNYGYH